MFNRPLYVRGGRPTDFSHSPGEYKMMVVGRMNGAAHHKMADEAAESTTICSTHWGNLHTEIQKLVCISKIKDVTIKSPNAPKKPHKQLITNN